MNDIVANLANKSGISPELAEKGLGAILGLIKGKLPAETYSKISAAVPGADGMVAAAAERGNEGAGGVVGTVTGALGKLFGGGDLIAKFTQMGFSPDQLQSFLPKVLEFFKGKLPPDVMNKITGLLPIPEEAAH